MIAISWLLALSFLLLFAWAVFLYRLWPDIPKTRHQFTLENIERLEKENAVWDRHLRKLMK
jgi:hypothetical protein